MKLSFKTKSLVTALGLTATLLSGSAFAEDEVLKVDPNLATYEKTTGISGNLSSVGSDTLANLMTMWAEAFNREYPSVNIQVQAAGSSTAPPALTAGTANFGPMSRAMKDDEITAFEHKFGYKPTAIPVAIDALAVMVNKDNPLKGLTLPEVDAIFSITHRCGHKHDITTWDKAGVDVWKGKSIQLYGRNSASGTYGFFKEKALCKGDFRNNVNEQPGSASVVQSISSSVNGIGYSGMGYITSSIKLIPLAKKAGSPYIDPTPENALNGKYPLARYLYIYVNKKPNTPLAPLEYEFIKMVLSKTGQEAVIKDGDVPVPAKVAEKALSSLLK
jgi:phosphate transport system substrate-binding protein